MASFELGAVPAALAERSQRLVRELAELVGGSTTWLAVTGLSRSGKTVFTTSLIHNLLSAVHNPNRMPLLNVVADGRLQAASIVRAPSRELPRFDYAGNIHALTSEVPDWPERTADVSEIAI